MITLMPRVTAAAPAGEPAKAAAPVAIADPVVSTTVPSSWDRTADVVVLGTGLSGLATAISAADAGASVLVLEKMDQAHEGGNSRVSANIWWGMNDAILGVDYILALEKGSITDPDIVQYIAQGIQANLPYIKSLGGDYGIALPSSAEWPVYPGASTVVAYYGVKVNGTPQFGGGHLWQLYRDNVTKRASSITVLYNTPATGLFQNPSTKEVYGVQANGGTLNIKANKAVVLACGGFEYNFDMQHQYLPAWPIHGFGTPGNTGDGIKMAQQAGADLWHMNVINGGTPQNMIVPEFSYPITMPTMPANNGYIFVDKHGNRYVNESIGFGRHGWEVCEYTLFFNGTEGDFLRIPTWAIFDDTARRAGPLAPASAFTWFGWYSGYTWSKDNSAEIAQGWILQGKDIPTLAALIAADPDNNNPAGQPTIDATGAGLQATITRWNGLVTAGADTDFGRPKATMAAITTAPFYAVKLWPGNVNTQGGPRRNTSQQVVGVNGNVIPRLYAVGECGSFWGWTYQGGGNLNECMFSGRTAGTNAAAETPWS